MPNSHYHFHSYIDTYHDSDSYGHRVAIPVTDAECIAHAFGDTDCERDTNRHFHCHAHGHCYGQP